MESSINDPGLVLHVAPAGAEGPSGAEKSTLAAPDLVFHKSEYDRLVALLRAEFDRSTLPETARATAAVSDLLVRVRLSTITNTTP